MGGWGVVRMCMPVRRMQRGWPRTQTQGMCGQERKVGWSEEEEEEGWEEGGRRIMIMGLGIVLRW